MVGAHLQDFSKLFLDKRLHFSPIESEVAILASGILVKDPNDGADTVQKVAHPEDLFCKDRKRGQ